MHKDDIDSKLEARLRAGDREAMDGVIRLYLPRVLRAARASGLRTEQAEDIVQAVFVTFIEKIKGFEGRSQVRTWLFGILFRKMLEAGRQAKRDRQFDDVAEVDQSQFHSDGTWATPPQLPDLAVYSREIREHIADCLGGVSDKQRMAFVLREVESMDTTEICEVLEVTPTNFGVLIHRARNLLRHCLETKGIGKESC
ncbi:MAG: sigma-70 family RNA polymerase sigma factor [Bryobacteraceae bacterium]